MGEINNSLKEQEEKEIQEEKQNLEKLDKAMEGLQVLSRAFKSFASKEEIAESEGRRCILAISNLRSTKRAYFFEVTGASIQLVEPYTDYTTLIVAPLDSALRVFAGIAAGDKWAFHNERARGKSIFKGTHSLHDMFAIGEAFKRFAELARRYAPGGLDLGI